MLWAPGQGGMINGLLTLRGPLAQGRRRPDLKFMVIAITGYGMSTFEGPMLSVKSVNSLSHYTDWTIAHAHSGALTWNGFGLRDDPTGWRRDCSRRSSTASELAEMHFWIATVGVILYILAIYSAGVTQGLMWRAFDDTGRLAYPDFVETVAR
ncbi:MAG: cbb3-type cytochrome c oxidase subunit I [Gemmatimonadaceae bacterium]